MSGERGLKLKYIKWEEPDCENCGSKKNKVFLDNITTWEHEFKFREVKCENCGLVFLSPRPVKESINYFYSSKTYWGLDLTSNTQDNELAIRNYSYGRVYKKILSEKNKGSIFDVGFGTGLFLSYFKELEWDVNGIELSKDALKYALSVYNLKGLKTGSIESLKVKKNSYDVITFNSSLEHLFSPKEAIKKAYKMLKNDGILVITVPNLESLGFLIFKKHWLGLHPPKHLYNFTQFTLSELLKDTGLIIKKTDHWFWRHSYYSFFESFRYMISPRFKGEIPNQDTKNKVESEQVSLKNIAKKIIKKTGILFVVCFATTLSTMGSILKSGEVITIYAKKN